MADFIVPILTPDEGDNRYLKSTEPVPSEALPERLSQEGIAETVGQISGVLNVEVDGVYPTRPEGVVVSWIGYTNPDAFMDEGDYWIDLGAPPTLSLADIEEELLDPSSSVSTAASVSVGAKDTVFISAPEFVLSAGTPVLNALSPTFLGQVPVWRLDPSTPEYVCASTTVPKGWSTATVEIVWAPITDGITGTFVRWVVTANPMTDGALISAGMQTMSETNRPSPTPSGEVDTFVVSGTINTPASSILRLTVGRRADNAADTDTRDSGFIGVRLTRAS